MDLHIPLQLLAVLIGSVIGIFVGKVITHFLMRRDDKHYEQNVQRVNQWLADRPRSRQD